MGKQRQSFDWHFCDEEGANEQEWQTGSKDLNLYYQSQPAGAARWPQGVLLLLVLLFVLLWHHAWQSASQKDRPTKVSLTKQPAQAALWGPEQFLATRHFVYRFRRQDVTAVAEVARHMDVIYSTRRQDLGLLPAGKRITITVRVRDIQPLDQVTLSEHPDLTAPSPSLVQSQRGLSPAAVLQQSVVYLLGEQLLAEKFAGEPSQPSLSDQFFSSGSPLIGALRLWQLWHTDGPLATLRQDLVTWLYGDADIALPDHYEHICGLHQVWGLTPLMMSIPLTCTNIEPIQGRVQPPLDLRRLGRTAVDPIQGLTEIEQRAQVIALETVFEYVVATYGRAQLPVLIGQLRRTGDWDAIVPAVFGTTVDAFEEGWLRYLAEEYAVAIP
jgi:hypothetical protein